MTFSFRGLTLFCKRIISSVLSITLLINLAAPLAAQTVRPPRTDGGRGTIGRQLEASVEREVFQVARESTRVDSAGTLERYLSDPDIKRLQELEMSFKHPKVQNDGNASDFKTDFLREYNSAIEKELAAAEQEIVRYETELRAQKDSIRAEAIEANVSGAILNAWEEETEAKIQESITTMRRQVNAWAVQARGAADSKYQEVLREAQNQGRQVIREQLQELLALYERVPHKALSYLISISITVLLADGRNTSLFSSSEKELLRSLYTKEVQTNTACYKENGSIEHSCEVMLNAITGLGVLGDESDGSYISDFASKVMITPYAAKGLLTGMSSLLALRQYGAIRGILATATKKENDVSGMDVFSFRNIADAAASGTKYLGEVSKWAQFPTLIPNSADTALGNAWEEVAYMLAEDGSSQALALLNEYGINQCKFWEDKTFRQEAKYSFTCDGIKPFLIGALVSGKAGNYTGPAVITQPGYVLDRQGRSSFVDEQQVQHYISYRNQMVYAARQGAAGKGITVPAFVARGMYTTNMGDLDADTQLALDQKLLAFFNKETKNQQGLAPEVRLQAYDKNSETYKAKQRSQHRISVWRSVGTVVDVGLLIWCAWDLLRLGRKAVTVGKNLYQSVKTARSGKSVATRLGALWDGSGYARRLLPQFTRVEEMFPHTFSAREVALASVKAGADGTLVVDGAAVRNVIGKTKGVARTVEEVQNSLNTAVNNANKAFANRSGLSRVFGSNNAAYRRQLSKELVEIAQKYKGADRGAWIDYAASVRRNGAITIPAGLQPIKQMPLFDNAGMLNVETMGNFLSPLGASIAGSRLDVINALAVAKNQTNLAYAHRGWLSRTWSTLLGRNKTVYNGLLSDNILRLAHDDRFLKNMSFMNREKTLSLLAAGVRSNNNINVPLDIAKYAGRNFTTARVRYHTTPGALFAPAANGSTRLPLEFSLDGGIKGVSSTGRYQRVVFTEKGGKYFMGLTDGLSKPTNLSNFKIDIPSNQLPGLIRGAESAGLAVPLEIKLTPYANARAFRRAAAISGESTQGVRTGTNFFSNLRAGFRNKTKIWTDEIPVVVRYADGREVTAPVLLKADSQLGLSGSRMVLNPDNSLFLMRNGERVNSRHLLRYSLPKKQITPFVQVMQNGKFSSPLRLTVNSGRNKLQPLFWTSGLSLSAASSGLITPLETTYKDKISEGQKTAITFIFPYLPSLLSPAIAPIVMKWGAANVLRVSLGTVAAGLAFSTAMGFRGNLDLNNPPPVWPLIVTAGAIGLSSAMSRSTLNVLIDSMGGGGSLLKSMAYKNAGSVFLLAPSFLYGMYRLRMQPAIAGKELTESELKKPASDFSLAFPVLTVLTLGALGWVSSSRLDPAIGRASAVIKGEPFHFWREMGTAWKTTFAPEVLPLSAATFAFTGFEAAAFSKGTNLSLKPMYEQTGLVKNSKPGNRANTLALVTGITAAAVPFAARLIAKPTLGVLADPANPATAYKRMLGISYGLNTAGGLLLMSYGLNPKPLLNEEGKLQLDPRMIAGITMMGLGTANVTQSFQKLANIRIGMGTTVAKMTAGMDKAAAASRANELKTMTMTSFSWSQFGIATLPGLQGMYVDREKAMDIRPANGPLGSLWIPMASLGVSAGLALYGIHPIRLPAGIIGGSKLLLDGFDSFNPMPYGRNVYQMIHNGLGNQMDFRIIQYRADQAAKREMEERRAQAEAEKKAQAEAATGENTIKWGFTPLYDIGRGTSPLVVAE